MSNLPFTTMQWVDRVVGTVSVLLLYLTRLVGFPFRKAGKDGVRTVLVQKYFGLGSITNAIPLLLFLREEIPDVKIVLITLKNNRPFIEMGDWVDEAVYVDVSSLFNVVTSTLSAAWRLNALHVDACLDLEFFTRFSAITAFLSRAPIRAGYYGYSQCRNLLFTHHIPFNHYHHISRVFLAQSEAVGLDPDKAKHEIRLPRLDAASSEKTLAKFGLLPGRYVLFNPNASPLCLNRRWPAANFARLAEKVAASFPDFDIVFIGDPSESEYTTGVVELITSGNARVKNISGRTTLMELLYLVDSSELVVTNDSLPIHLANGFGVNLVALFGPETPVLYGPNIPNASVLYAGIYCSPCINALDNKKILSCSESRCMILLDVDTVFAEVCNFMAHGSPMPKHAGVKVEPAVA